MRHFFATVLLIVTSLNAVTSVRAQDSSPVAQHETQLVGAGEYPELHVTVTPNSIEVPAEVPAGPLALIVDNQTSTGVVISPMQIADGDSLDDFKLDEFDVDSLPPAFHRATWAGGVEAPPDQVTGSTIVDLAPGQWHAMSWGVPAPLSASFTVAERSGDSGKLSSDPATSMEMKDFQFVLPAQIEAGTRLWTITNSGKQVHDIHILKAPEGTTPETVASIFLQEAPSTPAANLPDPSEFIPYWGTPPLSQGQAFSTEIRFEPGTYAMFTWFAERGTGTPQVNLGMYSVFTVPNPGEQGTPAASPVPQEIPNQE